MPWSALIKEIKNTNPSIYFYVDRKFYEVVISKEKENNIWLDGHLCKEVEDFFF